MRLANHRGPGAGWTEAGNAAAPPAPEGAGGTCTHTCGRDSATWHSVWAHVSGHSEVCGKDAPGKLSLRTAGGSGSPGSPVSGRGLQKPQDPRDRPLKGRFCFACAMTFLNSCISIHFLDTRSFNIKFLISVLSALAGAQ